MPSTRTSAGDRRSSRDEEEEADLTPERTLQRTVDEGRRRVGLVTLLRLLQVPHRLRLERQRPA